MRRQLLRQVMLSLQGEVEQQGYSSIGSNACWCVQMSATLLPGGGALLL